MTNDPLMALESALKHFRNGVHSAQAFANSAREHASALTHLPIRYQEVLHDLLNRVESSALFSDESCSFSQRDLIESVQMWLDKARQLNPVQITAPGAHG